MKARLFLTRAQLAKLLVFDKVMAHVPKRKPFALRAARAEPK